MTYIYSEYIYIYIYILACAFASYQPLSAWLHFWRLSRVSLALVLHPPPPHPPATLFGCFSISLYVSFLSAIFHHKTGVWLFHPYLRSFTHRPGGGGGEGAASSSHPWSYTRVGIRNCLPLWDTHTLINASHIFRKKNKILKQGLYLASTRIFLLLLLFFLR